MKEIFSIIFCLLVGVAGFSVLVYCLDFCFRSNHEVTESSPDYTLHLKDIEYKGHTYIYVSGPNSRTIVHAEHCKCHTVKK